MISLIVDAFLLLCSFSDHRCRSIFVCLLRLWLVKLKLRAIVIGLVISLWRNTERLTVFILDATTFGRLWTHDVEWKRRTVGDLVAVWGDGEMNFKAITTKLSLEAFELRVRCEELAISFFAAAAAGAVLALGTDTVGALAVAVFRIATTCA